METDTVGKCCKTYRHSLGFKVVVNDPFYKRKSNQPCSSPLAFFSLVTHHLCLPSPSFSLSFHPASCRHPPQSRCFSSLLLRSSLAAQGWSLRPLSSPSSHWSSRCRAHFFSITQRVFMCCVCFFCWIWQKWIECACTLNCCGRRATAPFLPPPSLPLRSAHWFAEPPAPPAKAHSFL